jgi:uncharacterized protein (DUF58 family)
MATVEYGNRTAPDPHVFAAATGRRAGVLRAVGIVAGVLALAWLAALALSLLGAGTLPGLLPGAAHRGLPHRLQSPAAARKVPVPVRPKELARPVARTAPPATATAANASYSHAGSVVTAPAAPAPAAAPQAPPSRGQGWAHRGWSAPPGQTRKGTGNGRKQADPATPPGQSGSDVPPKKG